MEVEMYLHGRCYGNISSKSTTRVSAGAWVTKQQQ